MKLRELRLRRGMQQKDLATAIGINAPMLSNFENYKCLPIPRMLKALCGVLECEPSDIYERHEIALQVAQMSCKDSVANVESEVYRLTANLPRRAQLFFKDNLQKLGYRNITEWANTCFENLEKQAKSLEETKKKDFTEPASKKSEVHNVKENIGIISTNNIPKNN